MSTQRKRRLGPVPVEQVKRAIKREERRLGRRLTIEEFNALVRAEREKASR